MKDLVSFRKTDNYKNINEMENIPIRTDIPKKLPIEVEIILNDFISDEYTAHFFYRNAANWCKNANYPKAAKFFESESEGELSHAKGIQDYLTSWNHIPLIANQNKDVEFVNLVDIIQKAYDLEYRLFMKYSDKIKDMLSMHPATFNFLQKYVDIQINEVSEYSDYLNAIMLINPNNKLDVLFFEDKYF